jgi:type IV secretory pathway VirB10-like protein
MEINKLSLLTYGAIGATCVILAAITIFDSEAYGEPTEPGTDSMGMLDSLKSSFSNKQSEPEEPEVSEEPEEPEVSEEPEEPEPEEQEEPESEEYQQEEPESEQYEPTEPNESELGESNQNGEPAQMSEQAESNEFAQNQSDEERPKPAPFGGISKKKNKTTKRKQTKPKGTRSRK